MKFKVGDKVVYHGEKRESGVVTKITEDFVFVRFEGLDRSIAVYEPRLHLARKEKPCKATSK